MGKRANAFLAVRASAHGNHGSIASRLTLELVVSLLMRAGPIKCISMPRS